MSEPIVYKGHKLLDDGCAADAYFDINGKDVLEDVAEENEAVKNGKTPRYTRVYGNLYIALRQNYANRCKEDGIKDPDVEGKTKKDFRNEIGIADYLNSEFNDIMISFLSGGKKAETAEANPEGESSVPSSTPSQSPKGD